MHFSNFRITDLTICLSLRAMSTNDPVKMTFDLSKDYNVAAMGLNHN